MRLIPGRVLGIDLAAQPEKTYACTLEPRSGALAAAIHPRCDDEALRNLAAGSEKVAIDAPFGWPDAFIDALVAHRSADAWPAPDDGDPKIFRASLSFRATDRVATHTRRPLSVSTDKLGVTAMRCAHLLHRWSREEPVDRTGAGRFVEVYPAGALVRWGLAPAGYKGRDMAPLAKLAADLVDRARLTVGAGDRALLATVDDAFDALVAALVGRAAVLGLTAGPPQRHLEQARREGWIHLPARGSLPFLARSRGGLVPRPEPALAERLRAAGVEVDARGYAATLDDALLPSLSEETKRAIASDLQGKGGSELATRTGGRAKFLAAHSSAALAANTFAPFLRRDVDVPLGGRTFGGVRALERECPTGLGGTPPTLDFLAEGPPVLAVESKCVEPFSVHTADFKGSYARPMEAAHKAWRAEYDRLREDPARYRHLDAAQLVKHYLGVRTCFPGAGRVTLAYLYWAPIDPAAHAACAIHAAEVAEFAARVARSDVEFLPLSYAALWDEWSQPGRPAWLREHASALRQRYEIAIARSRPDS